MKRTLEMIILPNPRKKKEFTQTLESLSMNLERSCSSLTIEESEEPPTTTMVIKWESEDQMQQTLKSEEFVILSGAIFSLCKIDFIRLDDKPLNKNISKLNTLSIKKILENHLN